MKTTLSLIGVAAAEVVAIGVAKAAFGIETGARVLSLGGELQAEKLAAKHALLAAKAADEANQRALLAAKRAEALKELVQQRRAQREAAHQFRSAVRAERKQRRIEARAAKQAARQVVQLSTVDAPAGA